MGGAGDLTGKKGDGVFEQVEDAAQMVEQGEVVFEVREGRALQRAIVTGPERQGNVVVTDGLGGSETLVARPPQSLKDGDRVRTK